MDGSAAVVETNAFLEWFQTWGQVVYIILQMVFWVVVAAAAAFSAAQAKRFVDFTVGKTAASKPEEDAVAVEEFVD